MRDFQQRVVDAAARRGGEQYRIALTQLIEWSDRQSALISEEHTGSQDVVKYVLNTATSPGRIAWSSYAHQGKLTLHLKDIAPLSRDPLKTEFRCRIAALPGIFPEWMPEDRPSVLALDALRTAKARRSFEQVLNWGITQIARGDSELVQVPANDSLVEYDAADDKSHREGGRTLATHIRRERSRTLVTRKRKQVLATKGALACEVCRFDFGKRYGDIGSDFCEVHHLRELSTYGGSRITSLDDLAIVCSNCHRMLHREYPALDLAGLRGRLKPSNAR